MLIKTRFLWMAWGRDYLRMRGWVFHALVFPRPHEANEGELVPALLDIQLRRDGPDYIRRIEGCSVSSATWTGMEFDWPPTIELRST